jgi:hypothetical protein
MIYMNILFALRGMTERDMGFGNDDRMGEGRVKILVQEHQSERVKILEEECLVNALFVSI